MSYKWERYEHNSLSICNWQIDVCYGLTRPDNAYAIGVVNRFLSNLEREHWEAMTWILRYLRGTSMVRLCFGSGEPIRDGYTDSHGGQCWFQEPILGFFMIFAKGAVSWQSKLKICVALSIIEAEYIVLIEGCKEAL